MALSAGTVSIGVKPDTKGFGSRLQQGITGESSGIGALGKKLFAPLAAAAAGLGVATYFKDAIGRASDLSESASKVGVVFGKQSAAILAASETAATAMGLSKTAYLDATGGLGNLLVSLKIAPKAAADLSQGMVKLAGDMASFNNVSPEEALAAIQSGLTGETEPLKRFGVNMNDATLKAQALKMGLIATTKDAMSPQTKALAAQALIMAQTGTAQGDFARTSGGLANQQRILTAQFDDVKTKIGGALLPAVTTVTKAFNSFVSGMQNGTGAGGAVVGFLKGIWAALQPVGTLIVGTVMPAFKALFAAFQAGGSDVTSGGFAGGMERIGLAARVVANFFTTQVVPAVTAIVTAIRGFVDVALPIVQAFVAGMMARIQPMLPTIIAIFATIGTIITSALELIRAVVARVTTVIAFVWKTWGADIMSFISGVFGKILVVIQAALTVIQGIIKTVTSIIKGDWSGAWDGIKQIVSGAWGLIKGIISAALNIVGGIMSAGWALIKAGIGAAWEGIKSAVATKVGELVAFVKGIPGKIVSGLGNLGSLLVSAGGDLLRGLANGITGAIGGVIDAAKNAAKAAVDAVKGALGIASPSTVFAELGKNTVQGFVVGIDGHKGALSASMSSMVKLPTVGSLDFASSAVRSNAVGGAVVPRMQTSNSDGGFTALLTEIQGLRADVRGLARTYQMMQRQMA